jgi:hypothetical protein
MQRLKDALDTATLRLVEEGRAAQGKTSGLPPLRSDRKAPMPDQGA